MNDSEKFTIQKARLEDIPLILRFIQELADFEKLGHEVRATEQILTNTLFGEHAKAEVILGYYQGKAVGFALYFHNFSTFLGKPGLYLEDLYVEAKYRSKGFGKRFFEYLAHLAVARDCGRLEWSVLDWNQRAIDFYKSLGAVAMDGWTVNRLSGDALNALATA